MFRTVPLSIIRSFPLHTAILYVIQVCWQLRVGSGWNCSSIPILLGAISKYLWHIPLLCVQWKTPNDEQRNCPKHVEFHSKIKTFEKLVHLVGFIIRHLSWCTVTRTSNPMSTSVPYILWWKSLRYKHSTNEQTCKTHGILKRWKECTVNTLRTGDADLRFYITTVQDGWHKSPFLTSACFPCTIHLIMQ